jgi:hypothetical protein
MCTVRSCGGSSSSSSSGGQCSAEAKQCPDGSYVGRSGPNCEFTPCPAVDCNGLQQAAEGAVQQVITNHAACTSDSDCVIVSFAADCFDACSRVMNKNGNDDLAAAKGQVNANQCSQFSKNGCTSVIPPCAPPGTPSCWNHVCTETAGH